MPLYDDDPDGLCRDTTTSVKFSIFPYFKSGLSLSENDLKKKFIEFDLSSKFYIADI